MSFNTAYTSLMPHSITLEAFSGQDGFGTPHFASAVTVTGLVIQTVKKITDANGQEKVSMTQAYLATTTAIGVRDRITVPTAFTPRQPRILQVQRLSDKDGLHSCVIWL